MLNFTYYNPTRIVFGAGSIARLDALLPADARMAVPTDKPVFFGHYWMHGIPTLMGPTYCCLDWSAARDAEPLVAYRFDGEPVLSDAGFVATCG